MNTTPDRTFGSVSVAMVTPFHPNGDIDIDSAVKIARKLVADGCDQVLLNGTTGESPTTHQPEKDELVTAVVEAVGDKVFIMAGAGSNDTAHAVRIAEGAQRCGANGLLVVSPYYNRPSQEGLYQHVSAILEATDLPVMLYDIPGRTGLAFSEETILRLAENPRVKAVKDATGNPGQGFERMRSSGLAYYSGDDGLNYLWLAQGGSGMISVVGHVAARFYRDMVSLVDDGNHDEARELATQLRPLVGAIMGTGQGAVMAKHALHLQGYLPCPTPRLPLVPATEEQIDHMAKVMRTLDLLD